MAVFAVSVYPPKTKPAVASPAAADAALAVFKFAAVDHAPTFAPAPVNSSVVPIFPAGLLPPEYNANVDSQGYIDGARCDLYYLKDEIEKAIITDKKLDPIDRFADDK